MKRIVSKFVREQKRYSKNELKNIFELKNDEIELFLKNLRAFGILKVVSNSSIQKELSDLIEDDIEIVDIQEDNDSYLYVFTYVGIVTVGSRIIKCYPKYLLDANAPVYEMKQILRVLNKYGSNKQIINLYNGEEENKSFNLLSVILYLINDYYEYGIYDNSDSIIEVNGEGEILWDRTINESFALLSNNRPYYMELYTIKTVDNEYDFVTRLHECVLSECIKQLEESQLLELFDMPYLEFSEENIENFGDIDYILYRLQSELNIQYNTRKQILLKTLYTYIAQTKTGEYTQGISMYGTNSFNLVWEEVCSEVFNNKLSTPIGQLDLPTELSKDYNSHTRLIDIIEKPLWIGYDKGNSRFTKNSKDTLTPDLIYISRHNNNSHFVILDAKYYNIQLEKDKKLRGYPGVSDITKQYLYQLAYKRFIEDHNIKVVKNCFLMPTQEKKIIKKGVVNMEMLSNLGLQNINIRLLPAHMMYEKYLSVRKMNIELLDLD